jgi:hypothetical protein
MCRFSRRGNGPTLYVTDWKRASPTKRDGEPMSDLIHAERGLPPWQPSPDAEVVAVYHRYNVPLIGLLRQQGVLHLFWCLLGAEEEHQLWVYAPITETEEAHLAKSSEEELEALIGSLFESRDVRIAFAEESAGVAFVTEMSGVPAEQLTTAALERLDQVLSETQEHVHTIQESVGA